MTLAVGGTLNTNTTTTANSNSLVSCNEADAGKLSKQQNTKVLSKMHRCEACADPEGEGDRGSGPLKNHNNIGFLSNTGPDPLKNHKPTKLAFNFGPSSARQRNVI